MLESLIAIPLMVAEIMLAEYTFALRFEKRKNFALRFLGSAACVVFSALLVIALYYKITGYTFSYGSTVTGAQASLFKFFLYVFILFATIVAMCFSYEEQLFTVMFNCSVAYATQHLAVNAAWLTMFVLGETKVYVGYFAEFVFCILIYVVAYFLLIRGKQAIENKRTTKKKVVFSLVIVLALIGVSRICTDDPTRSFTAKIAETVYAIITCVFVLNLYSSFTREDMAQSEADTIREINRREEEHYKIYRENAEILNVKYHDLKHLVTQSAVPIVDEESKNAVLSYECVVKTGNVALDTVLTEKNFYCLKRGVKLNCVVNGVSLSFMKEADVYTLFGNALSNAIECVEKFKDESKRVVYLDIMKYSAAVTIKIENYCDASPEFINGLPVTGKDKSYHGYGMKSIKITVEKYGGAMECSFSDGMFTLDIVFPQK